MESMRWIRGMVPLATMALLVTGVSMRPAILQAATGAWPPSPCASAPPPDPGVPAWYRIDARLDGRGSVAGQRLHLGGVGSDELAMDLPPESFATGPQDGLVLVGADDGTQSRLALVDAAAGCVTWSAAVDDVVRSALVAPDGQSVAEHHVDRSTRSDRGVWLRPLDGGPARQIAAGLEVDAAYGPTFTTELRWAPDGRLVVTSCGELACRNRLVEIRTRRTTAIARTGPVVGVADDGALLAYGVCPGYPCAVIRFNADGGIGMVVPAAGRAALAGGRLVYETATGGLAALNLDTGRSHPIADGAGLVPMRDGSGAAAGAEHPADTVLAAPAGQLDGQDARVVRGADGTVGRVATVRR